MYVLLIWIQIRQLRAQLTRDSISIQPHELVTAQINNTYQQYQHLQHQQHLQQ